MNKTRLNVKIVSKIFLIYFSNILEFFINDHNFEQTSIYKDGATESLTLVSTESIYRHKWPETIQKWQIMQKYNLSTLNPCE